MAIRIVAKQVKHVMAIIMRIENLIRREKYR